MGYITRSQGLPAFKIQDGSSFLACSNSNKRTQLFRSLHNVHTCQRLESIPKSFAEVHSYPKLFYYYRASKYLPFHEKDEVNAVAPDEDTKHCGLALHPHCWFL